MKNQIRLQTVFNDADFLNVKPGTFTRSEWKEVTNIIAEKVKSGDTTFSRPQFWNDQKWITFIDTFHKFYLNPINDRKKRITNYDSSTTLKVSKILNNEIRLQTVFNDEAFLNLKPGEFTRSHWKEVTNIVAELVEDKVQVFQRPQFWNDQKWTLFIGALNKLYSNPTNDTTIAEASTSTTRELEVPTNELTKQELMTKQWIEINEEARGPANTLNIREQELSPSSVEQIIVSQQVNASREEEIIVSPAL